MRAHHQNKSNYFDAQAASTNAARGTLAASNATAAKTRPQPASNNKNPKIFTKDGLPAQDLRPRE